MDYGLWLADKVPVQTRQTLACLMSPTFFIGIVPPPELTARVLSWQARLEHVVTAPHVTLLAPADLPEAQWQRVAAEVAARHAPVAVKLGGPDFFGSRVIFLKVDAPGLQAVHTDLVQTLAQPPGEFALKNYHPHLTLALSWRPMNMSWDEAANSAHSEFGELDTVPLSFTARELVLFGKAQPGQPYTERARFALAQS